MGGLFLSLVLLGGVAAPAPEPVAELERYMAAEDYPAAARILNDMALARSASRLAPDPLLSGLQGRLMARRGPPAVALAYLQYADSDAVPLPQRVAALFALAETREAAGDRLRARAAYLRLQQLQLDAGQQWRARLGSARTQLPDAPHQTLASTRELAGRASPGEAWEARLLIAEASLLLGDRAGARHAADLAWAASADVAPGHFAPQRVATLRAALALAEGQRASIVAALTTAGSSRAIDRDVAESLPICAAGRIEPTDWVTFTLFGDVEHGRWLAPVSASRLAAVAPFTDAIAGLKLFADGAGSDLAGGLVFTVRCRTAPSSRYRPPSTDPDPVPDWFASRGLFLPLVGSELGEINKLSEKIEELVRSDPHDPRLIPLRIGLAGALRARAATAPDVEAWQVAQLDKQAKEAMIRIGDTEAFPFELADLWAKTPEDAAEAASLLARGGAALSAYVARAPLDFAYETAIRFFGRDEPFGAELRRATIDNLARRFAERREDPRRRSLLLMLAEMESDAPALRKRWRATGLPLDLCQAGDEPPSMAEHHIDDDDFPKDLLRFALTGHTVFDVTVTAEGKVKDGRIILSTPSGLFDPALQAKLPGFEMKPMRLAGRPRECRGYVQRVTWKFPEKGDDPMPDFSIPDGPTS